MTKMQRVQVENPLNQSVRYLKGVGPYFAGLLEKKGIHTLEDILFYFPNRYLDKRQITPVKDLFHGFKVVLKVRFLNGQVKYWGRRRIYEWVAQDETGQVSLVWFYFNEKYLKKKYDPQKTYVVFGTVSFFKSRPQIIHPEIMEWGDLALQIEPIYPLTEGLSQKKIKMMITQALQNLDFLEDSPLIVRADGSEKISLKQSLLALHQPPQDVSIDSLNEGQTLWHKRVIYEELFYIQLGLILKKMGNERERGFVIPVLQKLYDQALGLLSFELTPAQRTVLDEIFSDFREVHPMNRLLQGDVGSGKTIVSFLSALPVIESGYQVALMAPTEILGEQHFKNLSPLANKLGFDCAYLTSSTSKSERELILDQLKKGKIKLMIGTHALFSDDIIFNNLAYIIIDEQHRFGVMQRAKLRAKGELDNQKINPHILVMTATPIPRTLSMTLHGDLDLSLMRERPIGRKSIQTRVFYESRREGAFILTLEQLQKGFQVYVVCPLIEESEKSDLKNAKQTAIELSTRFAPFKVGLLHGKMKSDEKESIMRSFKEKKLQILVSTTVIEVGVDVPNATVMIVEHAERFGLSQLHQLRGRVGRGGNQSYCFLMAAYQQSEEAGKRLSIMEETDDGFKISEEDLKIRGPGDFMGTRQAGLPDFKLAYLLGEEKLMLAARKRAQEILGEDALLALDKHTVMKKILKKRWQDKLNLSSIS